MQVAWIVDVTIHGTVRQQCQDRRKAHIDRLQAVASCSRAVALGACAGLFGTAAMNAFRGVVRIACGTSMSADAGDPGARALASALAEHVLERPLRGTERDRAGATARYAIGGGAGAVYTVLVAMAPVVGAARGLGFGAALWLVGDEIALPSLGFARRPGALSTWMRLYAFASHLVYGTATDAVRRLLAAAARSVEVCRLDTAP
jgi:hypothetical protein